MKRTLIAAVATALCLSGISAYAADPIQVAETRSSVMAGTSSWTMNDHLARAQELEREALRLKAEANGMETAEKALSRYVGAQAIQESGVSALAEQRMKEANKMLEMASFHREQATKVDGQHPSAKTGSGLKWYDDRTEGF